MPSFLYLNPMWGTTKEEQVQETPQRMEGAVVVNDYYKGMNLENKEFRMEFPTMLRMNSLIYLIMTSLPRMITNGIHSRRILGSLSR